MSFNRPQSGSRLPLGRAATASDHKPHISEKARQRPVRVIPADDRAEMEAGHIINSGWISSSNMIARPTHDVREGSDAAPAFRGAPDEPGTAFGAGSGFGPTIGADSDDDATPNESGPATFTADADHSAPTSPDDLA
jgi:hypothetical protein